MKNLTLSKLTYFSHIFFTLTLLIPFSAYSANTHLVSHGSTVEIDEHGTCKKVTNNHSSGHGITIPTKTSVEWNSTLSNLPPSGVSIADCVAPCNGTLVGGYCWYASGTDGASCDTICSSHGGCNINGTRDYAGSGGSYANCQSVIQAMNLIGHPNYNYSGGEINFSKNLGCHTAYGPADMWTPGYFRDTSPTTCSASIANNNFIHNGQFYGFILRMCACNN